MNLEAFQIERISETKRYLLLGRGACVAIVYEGSLGSSGYWTENVPAFLIWRDGRPWLVSKGREVAANPEQVEEIQKFSEDLKKALEPQVNTDEQDERGRL